MPLGADNFVQDASGFVSAASTSIVATLPSGTTAGNTVVVVISSVLVPTGTGFSLARNNSLTALYRTDCPAGETSWTFTIATAQQSTWYAVEVSGLDPGDPLEVVTGQNVAGVTSGTPVSTLTTATTAALSTMALAVFSVLKGASGQTFSWAGWTNGFGEILDVTPADPDTGYTLAVARAFTTGVTTTYESTATLTTSAGSVTALAEMIVFHEAGSPIVAPLATFAGFDWGTHGGAAVSGSLGPFGGWLAPSGTWGTTYLIQAGSARNSAYGLRIVKSAATGYVLVGNFSSYFVAYGMNVRVVSATGTVVVAELTVGAQLMYDSSATKFGVRASATGATSWATSTTALNTWVWIDLRMKTGTSAWHAEWRLETGASTYTDQPAADETGKSILLMQSLFLGGNVSQTITADFDDVVVSTYYAAYPLGPHECRLLTVDPAGTPTLTGTSTNFSVFTANGTLAAWNAVNARNAVDEIPVNISATADGVTQTLTATADYMEFPMATYNLGPAEYVAGVRMLAAIGSGTGAGSGVIAVRGWDGTTETALITTASIAPGNPTAITSTVPLWQCAMWQSTNGWTQAELDAAALRAGFSPDATPDMWIHVLYLEVAIGQTATSPLFGTMASAQVDPTRLGVVSVTMTAPDAGSASLYYETNASPTTVPVTASSTVTQQVNAPDQPTTNYVAGYWPPEGVPDA